MAQGEPRNINISSWTIVKILLVGATALFLYSIRGIIGLVFVAIIFAAALSPLVDYLARKKIPRWLAVLFLYTVIIGFVTLIILLLVPPIIHEVQGITKDLPSYYYRLLEKYKQFRSYSESHQLLGNVQNLLQSVERGLQSTTGGLFNSLFNLFGGLVSLLAVMVMIFYMLVEQNGIKRLIHTTIPTKYQPYLVQLVNQIQHKLGLWLRGQLVLSLIIAILTYIGLSLLHVKYALILALIAGILECIPYIGPILSSVPAIIITATSSQSVVQVFLVIILYVIIQALENNLIVPKVMQSSVGLNPVVVLIALLIGAKVGGVVGVILAIPITTIISTVLKDVFGNKELMEEKLEPE